jgi:signal peptidase II
MSLSPRLAGLAYGVAVAVVALDQAVKGWILHGLQLPFGVSISLLGPLRLTLVENRGISFGLFQSHASWTRWLLAAFSLAMAGALAVWARRIDKSFTALAVGLIMGGAVGNLIDRVTRGWVVDFIDVQGLYFPWVFNIADSAISVGVALLLAESVLAPKAQAR